MLRNLLIRIAGVIVLFVCIASFVFGMVGGNVEMLINFVKFFSLAMGAEAVAFVAILAIIGMFDTDTTSEGDE